MKKFIVLSGSAFWPALLLCSIPLSRCLVTFSLAWFLSSGLLQAGTFRAGTAIVDISPTGFPVIVNAMFTERAATKTVDPLHVRSLVIEDGSTRIAIAVVDTCMMSRSLIDEAKSIASSRTGIPVSKMLVSATHTHSAPSAMGCLGSRMDTNYARFLVPKIADAIERANARLVPARAGWTSFDATGYTHNRRWIRRSDRIELDPFGERTVRAHMHPGHLSPDAIGPSGPVDPEFTLLSIVDSEGSPLALLGNFSMHYYESALLSSDYFGKWCSLMESRLSSASKSSASARPVLALLSQGTSGDLMWMNYGAPRNQIGYEAYATQLAERAFEAWKGIRHQSRVPVRMAESHLNLSYRLCDPNRLAWAHRMAASIGNRLPQTLPEIYALEQIELHNRGRTEITLQALRIGDFGIAALPNEVFAITGLRLKAMSPLQPTMNIELANGGDGYIPPPEQHALGGYTTWAARTAGLETNAEPRIVETLVKLLEEVSGKKARPMPPLSDAWLKAVRRDNPAACWRLDETGGELARDASGNGTGAVYSGLRAYWLDGPQSPATPPNRAVHFVDGSLRADVKLKDRWTIEFWIWNGIQEPQGSIAGEIVSLSSAGSSGSITSLVIGGRGEASGRFKLIRPSGTVTGRFTLTPRTWHHVAWVRDGQRESLFVNGNPDMDLKVEGPATSSGPARLTFGGGGGPTPFQGKLDDIALFHRPLEIRQIRQHLKVSPISIPRNSGK